LPFSPMTGTDTLDKTIRPKVPEYLDIVAANSTHGIILLFRGHLNQTVDWSFLFCDAGDYLLHIVINSNNGAPYEVDLNFTWTLDPDTSTIFPVRQ
jgi:hypothetical protein